MTAIGYARSDDSLQTPPRRHRVTNVPARRRHIDLAATAGLTRARLSAARSHALRGRNHARLPEWVLRNDGLAVDHRGFREAVVQRDGSPLGAVDRARLRLVGR